MRRDLDRRSPDVRIRILANGPLNEFGRLFTERLPHGFHRRDPLVGGSRSECFKHTSRHLVQTKVPQGIERHLAVDLALDCPDEFSAVVGLEAATYTPGGFTDEFHHPEISNDYKAHAMYGLMSPTSPEAYRRETVFVYSQGAPAAFKGDLYYYSVDHDVRQSAANVDTEKVAVAILNGEYDWSGTPQRGRELAELIPGATYQTMEGLGHFPMSEDPERFLEVIRPVLMDLLRRC